MLGAKHIIEAWLHSKVHIDPFEPKQVGPNSYDVRLGGYLVQVKRNCWWGIDPDKPQRVGKEISIYNSKGKILWPWQLWLGCTREEIGSAHYVPMLEGRSSIARMGLFVHVTAGFGDVGFQQTWTLELKSILPIKVRAGMRIAQVSFHEVSDIGLQYTKEGNYVDQVGPTPSKYRPD